MANGKPPPAPEWTPDPSALKAFAHPLRMALFGELERRGAATASQLARTLGESSGQTSYHLRQLERHGFVEDDPDHVGGRERWWRPIGFMLSDEALQQHPETMELYDVVIRHAIAERAAALTAWLEEIDPTAPDEIGMLSQTNLELTEDEAKVVGDELTELLRRHREATRDRERPAGARRYRVHVDLFPLDPD